MEINIKHARLLDIILKPTVEINYPDYVFPTQEQLDKKVKAFKKIYDEKGKAMILEMQDFTGYYFKRNIIDCFIVSAISREMSAPLILRSRSTPEEFLENLMHELVHVLLQDNKEKVPVIYEGNTTIDNHIPVYKVLRHLGYDNKPNNEDYIKAWELSKI